jgi:hypothetical protein
MGGVPTPFGARPEYIHLQQQRMHMAQQQQAMAEAMSRSYTAQTSYSQMQYPATSPGRR